MNLVYYCSSKFTATFLGGKVHSITAWRTQCDNRIDEILKNDIKSHYLLHKVGEFLRAVLESFKLPVIRIVPPDIYLNNICDSVKTCHGACWCTDYISLISYLQSMLTVYT